MNEKSWLPTNKFTAGFVTAAAIFVISRFTEVDKDTEQFVQLLAPFVVAYVTKNKQTPTGDGVPVKGV
jgi:hypothetical protein